MLEREIRILEDAVREAGQEIVRISRDGFETSYKGKDDPLTTADLAANSILHEKLSESFPDYGWLSEESAEDLSRLTCKRVWVVDPIDGTREFIRGLPEFAISVALVEDGLPIVGVVHNPMTGEVFSVVKGHGVALNGKAICVRERKPDRLMVLGSRSEIRRGEFKPFEQDMDVRPLGSIAYKLALVAAGQADATFSLSPKNEWDIAAGVLLVEEAGGWTSDKQRNPFRFNQQNTLVTGVIATSSACRETVTGRIESHLQSSH
ncbi:3'(2'),5'-bisphosphate nucleotidase CysQ [Alicyclobacillus dauci]|uniref:inositol-phosphate phosphatase n=1 Tax=Alicyclobacillus dauci TaxID=1475485 RepID=A0ABY6YZM6_9BACL|nr:3'(2'),5'-bisphosphate nucleotidase CysQ [Alicyclobacillus dauci]WAH36090.1 3'(2'),5'-bisphosphate nucleotidase CysQ [Alicyclobacillus dauci]